MNGFAHSFLLNRRWREDPANAIELRRILNEPIIQQALEILLESGLPEEAPTPPGTDAIQWSALQRARAEGYFQFRSALRTLATPIEAPTQNTSTKPWEHIGARKPE